MFELTRLPYESLEPYVSAKLLDRHYNGHHKTYVDVLNKLVVGTEFEGMGNSDLKEIVIRSHNAGSSARPIFNNAAQIWNHDFYWQSMKPNGGGNPPQELDEIIKKSFGCVEELKNAFATKGATHFGSGWAWLVYDANTQSLKAVSTANADSPLLEEGQYPLLTMDVWEHAYYLDYLNVRKNYIDVFLSSLMNWDFVLKRLEEEGVL